PMLYTLSLHDALPIFFHIDQLFLKLPFERKVKMDKLLLKDKVVPDDNTFQNALNDVASIAVGTEVFDSEKNTENPEPLIRSEYEDRKSTRLNSSHVKI